MNESSNEYAGWLSGIARRYRQSQIKAAVAVNAEMLRFYFSLGADIVTMEQDQPWGSKFLSTLSRDLKAANPLASCFSQTNLDYCRRFFKLYFSISPQLEGKIPPKLDGSFALSGIDGCGGMTCLFAFEQTYPNVSNMIFSVPWGHHKYIMDKFRTEQEVALFYVRKTVENGWSRAVLLNFIDSGLHLRQGKAITNFEMKLPDPEKFEAAHLGQLGLYVSAANHQLRRSTDAPTIGLLICKSKDDVVAKWALESSSEPLGISEYQLTNLLPADLKSDLPTIAEIEAVT